MREVGFLPVLGRHGMPNSQNEPLRRHFSSAKTAKDVSRAENESQRGRRGGPKSEVGGPRSAL